MKAIEITKEISDAAEEFSMSQYANQAHRAAALLEHVVKLRAKNEQLRSAIETVCEGWTLPDGARKTLETALWVPPNANVCGLPHGKD